MKRLLILSGKGGTGKTTVAIALTKILGAKAVADCDVDAPNLHLILGKKGQSEQTLFYGSNKARVEEENCVGCGTCALKCRFQAIKMINGKATIDEIRCEGCGVCEMQCKEKAIVLYQDVAGEKEIFKDDITFSTAKLKMGRGNSGKLVTEVKRALYKETSDARIAVLDGSPGIGCPVISSVSGVDLVIVVAEPSLSGLSDLIRLYKTTTMLQCKMVVCINKWDIAKEKAEELIAFCKENGIEVVGKIPYDAMVTKAMNVGKSIMDVDAKSKDAMIQISQNVMKYLEYEK